MADNDETTRLDVIESADERRGFLQTLALSVGSVVGLSGSASATEPESVENTTVEPLDFDHREARESLEAAFSGSMLKGLSDDGLLEEESVSAIPFDQLADRSQPGGIEKLRVNGELEQYNFHIPVGDDRLEIMLPLSDDVPSAYLHRADGPEIVYAPDNYYQGEPLEPAGTPRADSSECDEPLWRSCATCWCCGVVGQRNEVKKPCPNCWLTDCHWVKHSCC
ncbi:hypothetical protein BV210_12465 [Halorientalis sp. IM1011]|uniref:hypothetical protein n=1 Tax=Halorientalis sp. IM1011 TaxID=1932360 RepID=UPI00097CD600|nr:hypothetical protein [Halorientalis sp. IM1011]AQL43453.1 hypothetical protein BV210_12465 [Halorientalis sp. IM1011]